MVSVPDVLCGSAWAIEKGDHIAPSRSVHAKTRARGVHGIEDVIIEERRKRERNDTPVLILFVRAWAGARLEVWKEFRNLCIHDIIEQKTAM